MATTLITLFLAIVAYYLLKDEVVFSTFKTGGLRFFKVGRITVSYSISKATTRKRYETVCLNPDAPKWEGKQYAHYSITTRRTWGGRIVETRNSLGTCAYPPEDLVEARKRYNGMCNAMTYGE